MTSQDLRELLSQVETALRTNRECITPEILESFERLLAYWRHHQDSDFFRTTQLTPTTANQLFALLESILAIEKQLVLEKKSQAIENVCHVLIRRKILLAFLSALV